MSTSETPPIDDDLAFYEEVVGKLRDLTERLDANNRQLDRLFGLAEPRPTFTLIPGGKAP